MCRNFLAAADNTTLYELDQLALLYNESIREFVVFVKQQDKASEIYRSGIKFVELCKQTKKMANIEAEAILSTTNEIGDDDVIDDEQ